VAVTGDKIAANQDHSIDPMSPARADLTIGALIDRAAAAEPAKTALVDDHVRLTRAQLHQTVNRLAAGLLRLGIAKGDAVLLQLPNWPEFVYSYFALQKIGAAPVLLISGYRRAEVDHLCRLTEAVAWIVAAAYRKSDTTSWIGAVRDANPQLRQIISVRSRGEDGDFTAHLEELMARAPDADTERQIAARRPKPTDIAHILPSGGTTGLPKAIPRAHADYLCNVRFLHAAGAMRSDDVCLLAVPVGHNLALLNVVGAALVGYEIVLLDSTRPEDICRAIEVERVTYFPTVPSLLKRVLEFDGIGAYDLRSLKKISAGGEPTTSDLVERVRDKLQADYISEFGMSEGPLCRTRLDDDLKTVCGSVGKPICPDDEFRILDGAGRALPAETDGELAARGPGIFAGYLKNPEENQRAFSVDGFFRTGDLARIDRLGHITITGRIKDVINRGGEKISSAQVEKLLLAHPDIADAAVIGMPDGALGERVCAYLRAAAGKNPTLAEIIAFMTAQGASKLLIPERVEFVDVLPLTEAGKHDKKALREDIQGKLERREQNE
jgi:2,3-dihydroxybenzoate-AMP ligase/mycobactin salicyl-AMP ligase